VEAKLSRDEGRDRAELQPWKFGVRADTSEIARRGSIASGISGRLRETRGVEDAIIEKGGMAAFRVLELRLEREADLENARLEADERLRQLRAEAKQLAGELATMRETQAEIAEELEQAARAALERERQLDEREADLRRRADELDAREADLTEIGELIVEVEARRNDEAGA
jgi:chromosome segregation ATPase